MPVVVGAPRSGTTLLRLMLDAHPELAVPAETGFLPSVAELGGGPGAHVSRDAVFETMTGFPTWADLSVPAAEFREALSSTEPFDPSEGVRCFYRLYAARHGKRRWGDKTPNYGLKLDLIEQLLPEAHFIHIIRDGRDVAVSLRGMWFAPGDDMTTLAREWVRRVATARELGRGARRYHEVRYERLIAEPERELERVCEFLQLPYDGRMLDYHHSADARLAELTTWYDAEGQVAVARERRLEAHRFTRRPPERSRVGRWRSEMTRAERREFEREAGPLLGALGKDGRRSWGRLRLRARRG